MENTYFCRRFLLSMIKKILVWFCIGFALSACNNGSKTTNPTLRDFQFEKVKGIRFEEVKRRFKTGLSFNNEGFMQKPSWIIEVAKEDTMMAWSPQKKRMQAFHLQYDHGNLYNFAAEYFKVKLISKDSLVLQRVQVEGRLVAKDFRSDVNMTFYAQSYIKNQLKTTAATLQKPSPADTAFIKKRCAEVNAHPDSAFAGTEPVQFTSKSKIINVTKISNVDKLNNKTEAYDYLFPEYRVVIDRAYKDFAYGIVAVVNYQGKIKVTKVLGVLPETEENKKVMMQGVADVYLKNLLTVKPASTLGFVHNSQITINVVGKAIKKP